MLECLKLALILLLFILLIFNLRRFSGCQVAPENINCLFFGNNRFITFRFLLLFLMQG